MNHRPHHRSGSPASQVIAVRVVAVMCWSLVFAMTLARAAVVMGQDDFDPYASSGFAPPRYLSSTPWDMNPGTATLGPYSTPVLVSPLSTAEGWFPVGTIFREYLADEKATRMSGRLVDGLNDSSLLDGTLGGKFALFRRGPLEPVGGASAFEVAVEGASQLRIDLNDDFDVRSVDFRLGLPMAYRVGDWNTRFGYYHLSSHLGDEFLLKRPTFERLNFSRDALFVGLSYAVTANHRMYGETSWAFASEVSEPIDFKFGIERSPGGVTGLRGVPFWALHAHLREEVDFGGHFTAQAGWAWRGPTTPGLLRLGFQYFNGKSQQFSFFDRHEQEIGAGIWYDY